MYSRRPEKKSSGALYAAAYDEPGEGALNHLIW